MHKHRERMIKRGPSVLLRLRTYRAVTGPAKTGDNHHRKAFLMEKGFSKGEKVSRINLSLDPTIHQHLGCVTDHVEGAGGLGGGYQHPDCLFVPVSAREQQRRLVVLVDKAGTGACSNSTSTHPSASPLSTGPPRDRGALERHRHASATHSLSPRGILQWPEEQSRSGSRRPGDLNINGCGVVDSSSRAPLLLANLLAHNSLPAPLNSVEWPDSNTQAAASTSATTLRFISPPPRHSTMA
jgi:hypothetical protein